MRPWQSKGYNLPWSGVPGCTPRFISPCVYHASRCDHTCCDVCTVPVVASVLCTCTLVCTHHRHIATWDVLGRCSVHQSRLLIVLPVYSKVGIDYRTRAAADSRRMRGTLYVSRSRTDLATVVTAPPDVTFCSAQDL
eukprot:209478-Prymnesium_polylepis.1